MFLQSSSPSQSFYFLLMVSSAITILLSSHQCGVAGQPVENELNFKDDIAQFDDDNESPRTVGDEVADLNTRINAKKSLSLVSEPGYTHNDNIKIGGGNLDLLPNLKYAVEVLQPLDDNTVRRESEESEELEERYKGPASINMNSDTFVSENIEMNDKDEVSMVLVQPSHFVLTIMLIVAALLSVALYAAFVIWRSHLEDRYGMRELLVSTEDDFCSSEYRRNSGGSDVTVLSRVA